jgi:hypothetical protein
MNNHYKINQLQQYQVELQLNHIHSSYYLSCYQLIQVHSSSNPTIIQVPITILYYFHFHLHVLNDNYSINHRSHQLIMKISHCLAPVTCRNKRNKCSETRYQSVSQSTTPEP